MRKFCFGFGMAIAAMFAVAGCESDPDHGSPGSAFGQSGELDADLSQSTGKGDGSDAQLPAPGVCNLACIQGTHCAVTNQGPSCVPDDEAVSDAGTSPAPGVCNLACIQGTHCVAASGGPSCVPDEAASDAGSSSGPHVCNLACIRGKHCVVTANGPSCIPNDAEDAGARTPCGTNTCGADETCCSPSCGICGAKGGLCPAIACPVDAGASGASCAATSCPTGTYCDDISGSAQCIPLPSCDTVRCAAGTTCELVQVQCIRAPCPPQPQCVPSVCNLACRAGTHCVVTSAGQTCEADDAGVACGSRTCAAGQICCSASCGICGTRGGACPAIACAVP